VSAGAAQSPQVAKHVSLRTRERFSYLLVAELGLIIGSPALQFLGMSPRVWGILGIGVFLTALYAIVAKPRVTAIAIFLAILAVAGNLMSTFSDSQGIPRSSPTYDKRCYHSSSLNLAQSRRPIFTVGTVTSYRTVRLTPI
jgi:hypothetical protein